MSLPDFKIPIEDAHTAWFWFREWTTRYTETGDVAFKELADRMDQYVEANFDEWDEEL